MKFGTTQTSPIDSGSNRNNASRKLGSSFQNAHSTSAKIFRRRISAACASVGALESGFTVEPCATTNSAVCLLELMRTQKRPTACPERKSNGSDIQRPITGRTFRREFLVPAVLRYSCESSIAGQTV